MAKIEMGHSIVTRAAALFAAMAFLWLPGTVSADGPDQSPIPSFYQEPGISANRHAVAQSSKEQIDPFAGKLQWHFADISIPGNGGFTLAESAVLDDGSKGPCGIYWLI